MKHAQLSSLVFLSFTSVNATVFQMPDDWKYTITGYIKHESFWDTRQVVGNADDEIVLFPEPKRPDINGRDINARGQFNMSVVESRVHITFDGPDIYSAHIKGDFETDIQGRVGVLHILRMRHSYVTVTHEPWFLYLGYTWHPLFTVPYVPRPVSNNAGQPFETYCRNPQIRFGYVCDDTQFIGTFLAQADFVNDGPEGPSSVYLRNAIVPELDFEIQQAIGLHHFGAAIDFKRIAPRLVSNKNVKVHEYVNSIIGMGFVNLTFEDILHINSRVTYAQNASEFPIIGGYAVHAIDATTDKRTYTPLSSISWWIDIVCDHFKNVEPGLFAGYSRNLGAHKTILPNVVNPDGTIVDERIFGFANNVKYLARVSPRVRWKINEMTFAAELEFIRAAFGTINDKGKVINAVPVNNTRLLLAMYYYF